MWLSFVTMTTVGYGDSGNHILIHPLCCFVDYATRLFPLHARRVNLSSRLWQYLQRISVDLCAAVLPSQVCSTPAPLFHACVDPKHSPCTRNHVCEAIGAGRKRGPCFRVSHIEVSLDEPGILMASLITAAITNLLAYNQNEHAAISGTHACVCSWIWKGCLVTMSILTPCVACVCVESDGAGASQNSNEEVGRHYHRALVAADEEDSSFAPPCEDG